jgi:hypothetical protein
MVNFAMGFATAMICEDGTVRETLAGTPQGGVISPLLANIDLNKLDRVWTARCGQLGILIRYADDFVAMCRSESAAREALRRIGLVMNRLGLTLHPAKTRLVDLGRGKESRGTDARALRLGELLSVGQRRPGVQSDGFLRDEESGSLAVSARRTAPHEAPPFFLPTALRHGPASFAGYRALHGASHASKIIVKPCAGKRPARFERGSHGAGPLLGGTSP